MGDGGDKVVRLPGTELLRPVIQREVERVLEQPISYEKFEGKQNYCEHWRVTVELDRRVKCNDCEQYVDAVDWIIGAASWWHRMATAMGHVQLQRKRLEVQVEELKREERRAKDRIRRGEDPDVKEARLALKQASSDCWRVMEAMRAIGLGKGEGVYDKLAAAAVRLANAESRLNPTRPARRTA